MITEGSFTDPDVLSLETMDLRRFSQHFSFRMDSIIPFFCGDTAECRRLGSQEALRTAQINIKEKVEILYFHAGPSSHYDVLVSVCISGSSGVFRELSGSAGVQGTAVFQGKTQFCKRVGCWYSFNPFNLLVYLEYS